MISTLLVFYQIMFETISFQKFADEYDCTEEKGDSFYPMLKSKVNIQGAVWCMKKEWIFSYSFDIFCR